MLAAIAEGAINRCLSLDPETRSRMAALEGKTIGLDLRGLDLSIYLIPGRDGIQVLGQYEGQPDTVIRGTPITLVRLGIEPDLDQGLFAGDVEILGDTETGQLFREILNSMDVDWEEILSSACGDVMAHQLGSMIRGANRFARHGMNLFIDDVSEYLQEEARLLPARILIENFITEVSELNLHADRLEARIVRLQKLIEKQDNGTAT
jgi:ubiquinone biosynthesis protein UbiJ